MNKLVTVLNRNIIGVVVFILCPFGSAHAAIYYVDQNDPTANDSNSGTQARPWSSLNPTTEKRFSPGDVIVVRAGTYQRAAGAPIINLTSSGKPGKPILFVSQPRHAAILDGQGIGQSAISITGRSHIVIDGFKIVRPGVAGIVAEGTANQPIVDLLIQNNSISKVRNPYAAADTDGIRLKNVVRSKIANNKINDIEDGAYSANAAGIKLYNVEDISLENNDITNSTSGIFVKANGRKIEIKRNFISNAEYAIKVSNSDRASIRYITLNQNIIKSSELAVQLIPEGGTIDKVSIENNIFVDYSVGALQATQPGMGQITIWNNIFDRAQNQPGFIADVFTYDDPPISLSSMDYNLFSKQPIIVNGLYNTNRKLSSLVQWKKYSDNDLHSDVGSARFKNVNKNNFRLKSNSRAMAKGRVKGRANGQKINIGAYTKNSTKIGYKRSGYQSAIASKKSKKTSSTKIAKADRASSSSATKAKAKGKSKGKSIARSSSASTVAKSKSSTTGKPKKSVDANKKSASGTTVSKKPIVVTNKNTNSNAKSVEKSSASNKSESLTSTKPVDQSRPLNDGKGKQKEVVVASIYPGAKPRKALDHAKIEWDVRNALKYDGACVLESNKIYFYDGHDNTGLKLRLLNNELHLVTKSNIDISYKDIGIQVGGNSLVHADSVVNDQTVLIKKGLPQLLGQLRKSDMAKVQLRFWPTYPATQTYTENIALAGFNEAYQEYKSCKKGN